MAVSYQQVINDLSGMDWGGGLAAAVETEYQKRLAAEAQQQQQLRIEAALAKIEAAPALPTATTDIRKIAAPSEDPYKLELGKEQADIARGLAAAGQRTAEGAATSKQVFGQQQGLANTLLARASGQTPSLATAEMKAASDRSLAQQLAAAGASRGGNQAALQRSLAQAQATAGQQIAQQAGITSLQEQAQNAQLAQQQLSGMAQQQLALLQSQADLEKQYIAQGMTAAQAAQQAKVGAYESAIQQQQFEKGQETSRYGADKGVAIAQIGAQTQRQTGSLAGQILGGIPIVSDIFDWKDGGPVTDSEIKRRLAAGGFPGAIMKQRYADAGVVKQNSPASFEDILATSKANNPEENVGISKIESIKPLVEDKNTSAEKKKSFVDSMTTVGDTNIQDFTKLPAFQNLKKAEGVISTISGLISGKADGGPINEVKLPNVLESIGIMVKAIGAADGAVLNNSNIANKLRSKSTGYGAILSARRK